MRLIDTHCHLDEESFSADIQPVVQAALDVGVVAMVTIGTTVASSRLAIELAERYPCVFAAVGIHPNYIDAAQMGDWEQIEKLAEHPRVVAIGETGLDRYWNYSSPEGQRDYFQRHMSLARQIGKPFIVHCRDADDEVRAMLRESAQQGPLRGVMHSFCQSLEAGRECVELGLHLSFTGMLTFKKNDALRATAAALPVDRLMVETDAPYLAPMPFRGKRCEPAYVRCTLNTLATAHNATREEMAEQTTRNAIRLFNLPLPIDAPANPSAPA